MQESVEYQLDAMTPTLDYLRNLAEPIEQTTAQLGLKDRPDQQEIWALMETMAQLDLKDRKDLLVLLALRAMTEAMAFRELTATKAQLDRKDPPGPLDRKDPLERALGQMMLAP